MSIKLKKKETHISKTFSQKLKKSQTNSIFNSKTSNSLFCLMSTPLYTLFDPFLLTQMNFSV